MNCWKDWISVSLESQTFRNLWIPTCNLMRRYCLNVSVINCPHSTCHRWELSWDWVFVFRVMSYRALCHSSLHFAVIFKFFWCHDFVSVLGTWSHSDQFSWFNNHTHCKFLSYETAPNVNLFSDPCTVFFFHLQFHQSGYINQSLGHRIGHKLVQHW